MVHTCFSSVHQLAVILSLQLFIAKLCYHYCRCYSPGHYNSFYSFYPNAQTSALTCDSASQIHYSSPVSTLFMTTTFSYSVVLWRGSAGRWLSYAPGWSPFCPLLLNLNVVRGTGYKLLRVKGLSSFFGVAVLCLEKCILSFIYVYVLQCIPSVLQLGFERFFTNITFIIELKGL